MDDVPVVDDDSIFREIARRVRTHVSGRASPAEKGGLGGKRQ